MHRTPNRYMLRSRASKCSSFPSPSPSLCWERSSQPEFTQWDTEGTYKVFGLLLCILSSRSEWSVPFSSLGVAEKNIPGILSSLGLETAAPRMVPAERVSERRRLRGFICWRQTGSCCSVGLFVKWCCHRHWKFPFRACLWRVILKKKSIQWCFVVET